MLGFAATAFGIAPLAPDAAELPQRLVVEAVQPEGLTEQIEALAGHGVSLFRSEQLRSGDTADSLLKRINVVDAAAAAFLRNDPTARGIFQGRSGKMIQARVNSTGQLEELVSRSAPDDSSLMGSHFKRLRITRAPAAAGGFVVATALAPLETEVRLGSGTVRQSLFAAADEARLPDAVASQIAEIFSADIDFHRELRRGDTFSVVFETLTADGESISWNQGTGRVLAAEFVNQGQVHTAVWFKDPGAASNKGAYYDMNGQNKRRSFLASPLEFSRVTSGFAMRLHPIMRTWRQHNGIDYGAPSGTAVRTVGDGVVEFAGRQGGYGNVVKVRHSNDRTTVYAHLSRIDVRQGARVEQGATIGAVGATGWATGPHLHFEFIVKGDHVNPIVVAQSSETNVVSGTARAGFQQWTSSVRGQLDVAHSAAARSNYAE